jgi:ribosomal-protein-alanine N-acetyltransferase
VEDVPEIVRFVNENREFLAPWEPRRTAEYYATDYWTRVVMQNQADFRDDRSLRMFLFPALDPQHSGLGVIGTVNFNNFNRGAAQYCTVGYSLAEREQGKGFMTEAIPPALKYVFDELNMHRVTASYLPHNVRSAALLKRLGFVVEGYARDYLMIDGKWQDHVITGIVNPALPSNSA